MNSEAFEELERMTNQPLLPTNDAPVQEKPTRHQNSWVSENWQRVVAWLWQRKNVHGKRFFIVDALHNLLGDAPKSSDYNALVHKLRSNNIIKPTDREVKNPRRSDLVRVWEIN